MDRSQLISNIIGKLKVAYPYYFKNLSEEETIALFAMYKQQLKQYNEETLIGVINEIIRKNNRMPTIKEIIDRCEEYKILNPAKMIEAKTEENLEEEFDTLLEEITKMVDEL